MKLYIGIDDTDNLESRGTGYLSRMMARMITDEGAGIVAGITRHQLLIDDRIPYTSQNSSACLDVEVDNFNGILDLCRKFIEATHAEGSDAGLSVAHAALIPAEVMTFGRRAKEEVLTLAEARMTAESHRMILEGISGDHGGMIGALAAVGLRAGGNDGRFIWLSGKKELRDIEPGIITANHLIRHFSIGMVETADGLPCNEESKIYLGDWVRPVLKRNRACLIVEKANQGEAYDYKVASKDYIRTVS